MIRVRLPHWIRCSLTVIGVTALMVIASAAQPQDLMRIAAVVNDEVISVFDLETRINMAVTSSNLQNNEEIRRRLAAPVLRSLIDEALQTQEAERQGIRVTESDLQIALEQIAANNGVEPGGLENYLRQLGISMSTVESQVRSQIAWGKYINQRIRPTINISEDEIDHELERFLENQDRPEYLVSQISLYFDSQSTEAEVMETANSLVTQLREGANFAAIAAQFSQGSMARNGGDLGWLQEGQSRPQFDAVLVALERGAISAPIRLLDGVHILQLRDKRTGSSGTDDEVEVYLSQFLIPAEPDEAPGAAAARLATAQTISDSVSGCDALNARGDELESSLPGDVGWVKLSDLPDEFRDAVGELAVGQASDPMTTGAGVHILMACERRDPSADINMRDVLYERIANQRLAIVERRLLRDLRRAAFVDLRI
ncbi:MAG: peptidylprolyl isomerase [Alphaproteobacteria bacterium]